MKPEWFAPHFEFRFPLYGQVGYRDLQIELRAALEPWHVMGEEGTIGGTARYVDSSLERLQVKVTGLRWAALVGHLQRPRAAAAADRHQRRARRRRALPRLVAAALPAPDHRPALAAGASTSSTNGTSRSVGGCTYHVMHPAGRNFETLPINDFEAEGRRLARFQPWGHTPGRMVPLPAEVNPEFPHTLDLRRFG